MFPFITVIPGLTTSAEGLSSAAQISHLVRGSKFPTRSRALSSRTLDACPPDPSQNESKQRKEKKGLTEETLNFGALDRRSERRRWLAMARRTYTGCGGSQWRGF